MAYEAQQAELVHAALVRASACTKCSWKDIGQNGLKGCRACLREHWRKCYLNRVNLETINSMNKNGQFDNPELIAFCRGMFSDAALERVTCARVGTWCFAAAVAAHPTTCRPRRSGCEE